MKTENQNKQNRCNICFSSVGKDKISGLTINGMGYSNCLSLKINIQYKIFKKSIWIRMFNILSLKFSNILSHLVIYSIFYKCDIGATSFKKRYMKLINV